GAGGAEVHENGAYRWDTRYVSGDVFRVAVVGSQVRYSKNGAVFYTSATAPVYPLLVDASLGSAGSTITNAVIAGNFGGADTTPPTTTTAVARMGPPMPILTITRSAFPWPRPTLPHPPSARSQPPMSPRPAPPSAGPPMSPPIRRSSTGSPPRMEARPRGTQPSPRLTRKRCQACLPPRRITTGSDHGMPRTIWRYRVMG